MTIAPQSWTVDAACRTADPDAYYPPSGQGGQSMAAHAKFVCRGCPVRTACLTHALETDEPWGIWGGLDAQERRSLRKVAS